MPVPSDFLHPLAVQLCRFTDELEHELSQRVELATPASLGQRAAEVALVLTNGRVGCPGELICSLPGLKLIAVHGVGVDRIDLNLCHQRGIEVATTPDALTQDVADLAVGLIIALLRRLPAADHHVRGGAWQDREFPMASRVSGKRFGIAGLGRIGRAIAERLSPFGPVAYWSQSAKEAIWPRFDSLTALAEASDVLILACAANDETIGVVDAQILRALGPQGYLINIARGSLVDEKALEQALAQNKLAGAALDVFATEPTANSALRQSSATMLSPHIGSATGEARDAMKVIMLENIDRRFRSRR